MVMPEDLRSRVKRTVIVAPASPVQVYPNRVSVDMLRMEEGVVYEYEFGGQKRGAIKVDGIYHNFTM